MQPDIGQLAARLLYLTQQEKAVASEKSEVKDLCEQLFLEDKIAAKSDNECCFTDGSIQKVRLNRRPGGTYFKVEDDYKDGYAKEVAALQAEYLRAGKATMADKSCTWVAQVVKS